MGTKSWVLKRTPKRGSQNWVDKKKHFALRFPMFRAIGVKIWGSFKHPAAYIYICAVESKLGPKIAFF